MSLARMTYRNTLWQPRALRFAESLRGRPRTATELKFMAEHPDKWDYFSAFGIQEESQGYIDATIDQLRRLDPADIAAEVTITVRLEWSALALKSQLRRLNLSTQPQSRQSG